MSLPLQIGLGILVGIIVSILGFCLCLLHSMSTPHKNEMDDGDFREFSAALQWYAESIGTCHWVGVNDDDWICESRASSASAESTNHQDRK